MFIQDWINHKLKDIAEKLPTLVHTEPASFSCGYNAGYKKCLIDLEIIIEDGVTLRKTKCRCGDKFHEPRDVCL